MLALSLFKTSNVFELLSTHRHAAIIDLHAYARLIDLPSYYIYYFWKPTIQVKQKVDSE